MHCLQTFSFYSIITLVIFFIWLWKCLQTLFDPDQLLPVLKEMSSPPPTWYQTQRRLPLKSHLWGSPTRLQRPRAARPTSLGRPAQLCPPSEQLWECLPSLSLSVQSLLVVTVLACQVVNRPLLSSTLPEGSSSLQTQDFSGATQRYLWGCASVHWTSSEMT